MKTFRGKWWYIAGASVVTGFVLLGFIAKQWLESPRGQALLQRELESRLGMAVTIDPGYELGFFPTITIEGAGLEIAGREGPAKFVSARAFEAGVEVIPLFREEVKITSVALAGGSMQLDQAPIRETTEPGRGSGVPLPEVASLLIEDFTVRLSSDGVAVHIGRLSLADFKAEREVPFELEAAIPADSATPVNLDLEGVLSVSVAGPSASVAIDQLRIDAGPVSLADVTGSLHWFADPGSLGGRLAWESKERSASIDFGLQLAETVSGEVSARYADSKISGAIDSSFDVHGGQELVRINELHVNLSGQAVQGQGCFVWDPVPELRLVLEGDDLDLDALEALMPESSGGSAGLPLGLAVSLAVARARLRGAEALDARVLVGAEPVCPD